MTAQELAELCAELRSFMVENVSKTGGHLAASLGAVELTVAVHRVFDTSSDRLVFDVGHQGYAHKILTGRRDGFSTLRQTGGLSGFPKPSESIHDAFIAGHASNSISVGLGMARACRLTGGDYSVVTLTGDGALTGGMTFEALNDAGGSGEPLIVILNDNGMAITKSVGGLARYLSHRRIKPSYISFKKGYRRVMQKTPGGKAFYRFTHRVKTTVKEAIFHCSMFEEMGFTYIGPIDGHNIQRLEQALSWAKELKCPVLVHVITQKGRGYSFAEENPDAFHGVSGFDVESGAVKKSARAFSDIFGETVCELAEKDRRIMAVTAAMASGTGLVPFAEKYPDRFFDVGIAEGHAAAMCAGAAKQGAVPVLAVYSTFLQRAYDMLIHDVGLGRLHVVFAVDRAGLVGADGETHHGVFDVAYLSSVPGMAIFAPASFLELREMFRCAVNDVKGPVAVRFPRGGEGRYKDGGISPVRTLREGDDVTVVTYGVNINDVLDAADMLERDGISAEVIKLGVIRPIDIGVIERSATKTGRVVVVEECAEAGCVGQQIVSLLTERGCAADVVLKNLGSGVVTHGDVSDLRRMKGIDAAGVYETCVEVTQRG